MPGTASSWTTRLRRTLRRQFHALHGAWLRARFAVTGRVRNPLFDEAWYLWRYPDVRELDTDPREHYWSKGAPEGRDPNPFFATRWYAQRNLDATAVAINPLDHYFLFGAARGLHPSPAFDATKYLEQNEDVRAAGMNPLLHYLRHGMREGRRAGVAPDAPMQVDIGKIRTRDEATGSTSSFAACTIIARNYLSYARVLADSFLRHHPGRRFYVLIVDGLPEGVELSKAITVVDRHELGLSYFHTMAMKYDVTELATALKPTLLSLLLNRYGEDAVVYFDPDILITRPLVELEAALEQHQIVLTPHLLRPIPLDGRRPSEQDILIAGTYNLGFIGVHQGDAVSEFLTWWEERLRDHCRKDPSAGLMVDQKWVNLAAGMFEPAMLRDDAYNVAYWNLNSRDLEYDRGRFLVNGRPLAFFHYSGFDPATPACLSKHQNRLTVDDGTPLARLLELCASLNLRAGHAAASEWEYGYSRYSNGVPVHPIAAQMFLDVADEDRTSFGDPFDADAPNSFFAWLTHTPAAGLSRFLQRLWDMRTDLQVAFPDAATRQRAAFIDWATVTGSAEMGYDPAYSRRPPLPDGRSATGFVPVETTGVNVVGYLRNESGVGAAARGYVRALRSLAVPVALHDVSHLSPNRSEDHSLDLESDNGAYEINLVAVNADQHFHVAAQLGEAFFEGRYSIGVWQWELPSFPSEWHDRFEYYDEIWVGTSFILNSLAPVSPIPVVRVPPPLRTLVQGSRKRGRRKLGCEDDETLFTFMFDYHSFFMRKNPLAVIDAFRAAFPASERARLVIKCANPGSDSERHALLEARAATDARISILAGYWSTRAVADLFLATDAYVSLHRSEGIGLTISDAMAVGKPVIATAWSGNTDYMSVANSFPIGYELTQLREDVGPYRAGAIWAEPSIDEAAAAMRLVLDNPAEAQRRGGRAARDIEDLVSVDAVAQIVSNRLHVIATRQLGHALIDDAQTHSSSDAAGTHGHTHQ